MMFYYVNKFVILSILELKQYIKGGAAALIRLWGKIITNNKIIASAESTCDEEIDYQEQLKKCIIEICYKLDLQKPYWLPKNLKEYNQYKRTAFRHDNFIENVNFDKFEIEVIEEK
jgi:hypothetical protein